MKKRTLQLLSLLLLFCMAGFFLGCKEEKITTDDFLYEEDGFTFHEQVTFEVTQADVGAIEISYLITNNSYRDLSLTQSFQLQIKSGEEWKSAPPMTFEGELIVPDRNLVLYSKCEKQTTCSGKIELQNISWGTPLYDPLVPGEYRLIKHVQTSDGYDFDLVAYFTVTEAPA